MESNETRIVWMTLLAMADKNGEVQASIPGLANIARVDVEACRTAIKIFESPDPDSRTKDEDGRRIQEIKGGWHILNHEYYRELGSEEDQRRKAAERQRRYRERQKRNGKNVTGCDKSHQKPHTDTKADTEANTKADTEAEKGKEGNPSKALKQKIVDAYNDVARERKGWRVCSKIPQGEVGIALNARCSDKDWVEDFPKAMALAKELDWMTKGKLETFLRPDSVRKLIDGEWAPSDKFSSKEKDVDIADMSPEMRKAYLEHVNKAQGSAPTGPSSD